MKFKNTSLICLLLVTSHLLWSQGKCSKYYPMVEGAKITLTAYQANHDTAPVSFNEMGVISYDVVDVTGDSANYKVSMSMAGMSNNSEHTVSCTDDGVSIDFRSMSSGMLSRYGGGAADNMEISGDNIYLPNDLELNKELDPASIKMSVNITTGAAGGPMNIEIKMINRKVIAMEEVETPVDKYNCFVIRYNMEFNGVDTGSYTKQWVAEDVGVVKIEEYTNDGVIQSRMVLTSAEGID